MNTLKNIGLIDCGGKGKKFQLDSTSSGNGFKLVKVLIRNNISRRFSADELSYG